MSKLTECFFCRSKTNIKIANIKIKRANKIINGELCHVCFNKARYTKDGLAYKDKILRL